MNNICNSDEKMFTSLLKSMKEHENLLKYNLNLIDELHANENAHTRILIKLLSCEQNGKKVYLNNFIKSINTWAQTTSKISEDIEDFEIYEQYNFVDAYFLSKKHRLAVIIENKINGAIDQEKQIERYVETAKNDGCELKNIYCIYLTDDGNKTASGISLTEKVQKELEYGTNNSRYIELNYKTHILSFLKSILEIVQNGKEKEPKIVSALFQYIDYLEGRFSCRSDEQEYFNIMVKDFKNLIGLQNFNEKSEAEKLNTIEEYRVKMNKVFDVLGEEIFPIQDRAYSIREKLSIEINISNSKKINSNEYNFFGVTLLNYQDLDGYYPDIGIGFTDNKEYNLTFSLRHGDIGNHNLCNPIDLENYVKNNSSLNEYLESMGFYFDGNNFVTLQKNYTDYNDVKNSLIKFAEDVQKVLQRHYY